MRLSPESYVPQLAWRETSARQAWAAWGMMSACAFAWLSLIVSAPLALARGHGIVAWLIYRAFGVVCHQMPERSFYFAGHPVAVCARCFGIYVGFALSALLYPLMSSVRRTQTPPRVWLLIGALPTTIDFALGFFGVWMNTHWSRALTGAWLGAVTVFFVAPGFFDMTRHVRRRLPRGKTFLDKDDPSTLDCAAHGGSINSLV